MQRQVTFFSLSDCQEEGDAVSRCDPSDAQSARVAVADRFLARRRLVDGFEREGDFDEFFS